MAWFKSSSLWLYYKCCKKLYKRIKLKLSNLTKKIKISNRTLYNKIIDHSNNQFFTYYLKNINKKKDILIDLDDDTDIELLFNNPYIALNKELYESNKKKLKEIIDDIS